MIKIEKAPWLSFRGYCLYLPPKIPAHSCQPFHLFTCLACSRVVYWYFQELSLPLSPHDVIPGSPPTITEAPPLDRSLTAERSDEVSIWLFIETPFNAFAKRTNPDQEALQLPDQGLLCLLWKYYKIRSYTSGPDK